MESPQESEASRQRIKAVPNPGFDPMGKAWEGTIAYY